MVNWGEIRTGERNASANAKSYFIYENAWECQPGADMGLFGWNKFVGKNLVALSL